jgi:hypothetical protein
MRRTSAHHAQLSYVVLLASILDFVAVLLVVQINSKRYLACARDKLWWLTPVSAAVLKPQKNQTLLLWICLQIKFKRYLACARNKLWLMTPDWWKQCSLLEC